MNIQTIFTDSQEIKQANEKFLQKREEEILDLLAKEPADAEEALQQEIMSELLDKLHRINHLIRSMEKARKNGVLSRGKDGGILFNGEPLLPLKEFEVCLCREPDGKEVWTRTFVSMALDGELPYLAGHKKDLEIDGIKARI